MSRLNDADLRGSDLSGLSGLASRGGVQVTGAQLHQLTEIMIRDLGLTVVELPL